jgi:Na+/proline symporter
MSWQALTLIAAVACGLVGLTFFSNELPNPELLFVEMVQQIYNPFWAGFILCAILAANMSTMDSQVLVCASTLSEDLWCQYIQPAASQRQRLRVTRACIIGITLIALAVAFMRSSTVLEAVLYAWTGLGCSFGPVVLLSLYYPNANRYGAFAGILIGGCTAALWDYFYPHVFWNWDFFLSYRDLFPAIPAMISGFTLSSLAIVVVSKLTASRVQIQLPQE